MKFTAHPLGPPIDLPRVGIDRELVNRLRGSFAALEPVADRFTEAFYGRLFAAHPPLRAMFPQDMAAQKAKLIAMLRWIIDHLEDSKQLRTSIRELGKRHESYNARPEHYPIVSEHMIGAMREAAGSAWTKGIEADWRTVLDLLNSVMLGRA